MSRIGCRAFVASVLASPAVAWAQEWPTKQITMVVPFPPGGSVDAISRMLQPGLEKALGATVVVVNRTGASGSIGTAQPPRQHPMAVLGWWCSTRMPSIRYCSRCPTTQRRISSRCC